MITIKDLPRFLSCIKIIKNFLSICQINISDVFSIKSMDNNHLNFIDFNYKNIINTEDIVIIDIDLEKFFLILNSFSEDIVFIRPEKDNIFISNESKTRQFKLGLMDIDCEELNIPSLDYNVHIIADMKLFVSSLKDLNKINKKYEENGNLVIYWSGKSVYFKVITSSISSKIIPPIIEVFSSNSDNIHFSCGNFFKTFEDFSAESNYLIELFIYKTEDSSLVKIKYGISDNFELNFYIPSKLIDEEYLNDSDDDFIDKDQDPKSDLNPDLESESKSKKIKSKSKSKSEKTKKPKKEKEIEEEPEPEPKKEIEPEPEPKKEIEEEPEKKKKSTKKKVKVFPQNQ